MNSLFFLPHSRAEKYTTYEKLSKKKNRMKP